MAYSQTTSNQAGPSQFNFQTALLALRCWWKIAMPAAIVLAAVAGGVVFALHTPTYTADALLLIAEKEVILHRDVRSDSQRFIQNQFEFIRSPRLLGSLASQPAILAAPELAKVQDVTLELAKRINIKPRNQSDLYVVSYTSEAPEKAQLIVKQVVDAYLMFNTRRESEQDARIIRLLEEQRAARYEEMNQLREVVRTLSIDLTGVDPYRSQEGEESRTSQNPLAALQEDKAALEIELEILAHRIKFEENRQGEASYEPSAAEINAVVESHPAYVNLLARISVLQTKEAEFQRVGKDLASNVYFTQLQAELRTLNGELEPLKAGLQKEIQDTLVRNQAKSRAQLLTEMKEQYEIGKSRLSILTQKFEQGMGSAKKFAGTSLELEFRKAKLEQVTETHDQISARILAITTEQRAPARVELFKEPSRPLQPDELIPWKKIGIASGIAFLFPLALAIGWENLFRRVSTRSQFDNHQIIVVGEVTSLPARRRKRGSGQNAVERDALLFEESVDSLRTYLSLVESLRGLRVLAITSAVSGEGKTSLACELAVSIARATGEPTLLIDGDMRLPDLHKIFDVDLSPGLADVLAGECPVEEALETNFNEKLHILTAGRLRTSPHRLLGKGEFQLLLDRLGETYRHIIVDTPPILAASEALVLARSADAAVLCMRRDYSRIRQVQEAHARMASAGVRTAGAVLNGIPIQHYAYNYGSYHYNRPPDQAV